MNDNFKELKENRKEEKAAKTSNQLKENKIKNKGAKKIIEENVKQKPLKKLKESKMKTKTKIERNKGIGRKGKQRIRGNWR